MHPALSSRRDEISELCRRYRVTRLEAFGSAARGADFDPELSDADFLVAFDAAPDLRPLEQYFGFADQLGQLLGRKIDLIEEGAVRNPYLKAAIERDRELVFAA